MAATVKYQEWGSGTYNWYSSTNADTCGQVINELKSWVTTINGNASQTGKQLVVEKDESDSTDANFFGFVLNMPTQNVAGNLYFSFHTTTTINLALYMGTTWTDNGTNGGYGAVSGGISDTSVAWKNTLTTSARFMTATGTTDGEEYFALGWEIDGDNTYADCFVFTKDVNGEWLIYALDTLNGRGMSYDTALLTPAWRTFTSVATVTGLATDHLVPFVMKVGTPSGVNNPFTGFLMPASQDFFALGVTHRFGDYAVPNGGYGGDQFVSLCWGGPLFRYTPV